MVNSSAIFKKSRKVICSRGPSGSVTDYLMIIPNRAEVKGAAMKTAAVRGLRRKLAADTPVFGRWLTLKLTGRHAEFPLGRDGSDKNGPMNETELKYEYSINLV